MVFYLTYNEGPSGVYFSQVTDVVKFLGSFKETKLIAFISMRNYFSNRQIIKNQLPDSIVLPMYPKMANWKNNSFLILVLCYIFKPQTIIARSVMATKLALLARERKLCNKVVYDGRGAIAAEWKEYKVVSDKTLLNNIEIFEKEALKSADFRISVSQALVDWWREVYDYKINDHVVIPCTLNSAFSKTKLSKSKMGKQRKLLGLDDSDTVYIYSGSHAAWQSFDLTKSFIIPILQNDKTNKIIFFSPPQDTIFTLQKMFPEQVIHKHLKFNEVSDYLILGDYGILIRNETVTNKVASPIKFAEYLACGLKVIICDKLGDYTGLSEVKNWGIRVDKFNPKSSKPGNDEKLRISTESIKEFSKENYAESYKKIIQ